MDMKKIYVTPEIEYDDFSLNDVICANLYENPEFYAVGGGYGGGASEMEGNRPDIGGEDGDDMFGWFVNII